MASAKKFADICPSSLMFLHVHVTDVTLIAWTSNNYQVYYCWPTDWALMGHRGLGHSTDRTGEHFCFGRFAV